VAPGKAHAETNTGFIGGGARRLRRLGDRLSGLTTNVYLWAPTQAMTCSARSVCGVAMTAISIERSASTLFISFVSAMPWLLAKGCFVDRSGDAGGEDNRVAASLGRSDEPLSPFADADQGCVERRLYLVCG
jgi:hypothetical protein